MFTTKYPLKTHSTSLLSDLYTPIGIYLRVRDKFRDTVLLESAGNQNAQNNFSFIAINPIAGVEISTEGLAEIKFPLQEPEQLELPPGEITSLLHHFTQCFPSEAKKGSIEKRAQGLFGYIAYDAVQDFQGLKFADKAEKDALPLVRFRLYQYVIAINHHNDEMFLLENVLPGLDSQSHFIKQLIQEKNAPVFPFKLRGEERSNLSNDAFISLVEAAKKHIFRGDVFQIVLSRQFSQGFEGDDFNVYRALRHINPSPYLFYFDFGDYRLMGSSPESQLLIENNKATIHPIAGTFARTHDAEKDLNLARALKDDPKENSEHTMLVDLARNDLSIMGKNTTVTKFKEIHLFSHVIHMVSEVQSDLEPEANAFAVLASTFPQGTLSGAPKRRAMELIDSFEPTARQYYGGAIGFMGLDGTCNMAIMIRTLLSKNYTLSYQAGAGIVASSVPHNELKEVDHKLGALKQALIKAQTIA